VLAAGRRQPATGALDPENPPTAGQYRQLALYLFDAYSQAVAPAAAIRAYAREVLEAAYRRAFDTCGIRMQQLAAGSADRHVICRKDFAPARPAGQWIGELYAMADTRTVGRTS
jgi:hypothetical protein